MAILGISDPCDLANALELSLASLLRFFRLRGLSQSSLYREAGRIADFIILVAIEVSPILRLFTVRMCLAI